MYQWTFVFQPHKWDQVNIKMSIKKEAKKGSSRGRLVHKKKWDNWKESINDCMWHGTKGPSIYYVSIILDFSWPTDSPTHPLKVSNQHKYSNERQQHWQFSRPTHPVLCWRNIWMELLSNSQVNQVISKSSL